MEVLYFNRGENVHVDYRNPSNSIGSFVTGIYVISENIALCRQAQAGSLACYPFLTGDKDMLNDLRGLEDGYIPDKNGVIYSGIKKADVDEDKMRKLIEDAEKVKELEPIFNSSVSNLMSEFIGLVKEINK